MYYIEIHERRENVVIGPKKVRWCKELEIAHTFTPKVLIQFIEDKLSKDEELLLNTYKKWEKFDTHCFLEDSRLEDSKYEPKIVIRMRPVSHSRVSKDKEEVLIKGLYQALPQRK